MIISVLNMSAEVRKESPTKDRIAKRTTSKGEVRYDVRVRLGGKPARKTFLRRADADAWLRQVRVDDMRGVTFDPKAGRITFTDYSTVWLERGGTRGHLAPKTRTYYEDLLRIHLRPTFGASQISAIRTEAVRDWLTAMRVDRASLAPKCYRLLSTILGTAVSDGRIAANPCNIKGAGVERAKERPLISPRDAHDLADAMDARFRLMILLAEFAQLRLGELLGLRVGDVNLAGRTILVERQAIEVRGQGRIVTAPKTDAGKRRVSIPDGLVAELAEHIDAHCIGGLEGALFANEAGRPWWRWEWQRAWNEARDTVNASRAQEGVAGLPEGLHMHDLRHSGLTYVAHSGVTTKELMRRGGHASPNAALRYQHEADGRDREIADALGILFDAPRDRGGKVTKLERPRHRRAIGSETG